MLPTMLRRRRGLGKHSGGNASTIDFAFPVPRPVAGKESEIAIAAYDDALVRSGTQTLSRIGYDEDKCRNVLVRYCAHVPRNYQYKDGVQQIFLILREHLGDENLDLAGGVLYELIEIDCEYSDDPGAAFQRWRHDHMCRYADLELPHIPHMMTITSSVIPTARLARWRLEHSERYPFVLSDSSPSSQRLSFNASCIRNRKAWLIDHTLYVSSRNDGTRPLHKPNPQEFHEMQWNSDYGSKGRLVEEHDVILNSPARPNETSPPGTADARLPKSSRAKRLHRSLSNISIMEKISEKLGNHRKEPETEQRRRSWMPSSMIFETGSLFKDKRTASDNLSIPLPGGCEIPNAIFARKFLLVDDGDALPPYIPISQMPIAESKATDTIAEAAASGLLNETSSWTFRGPFTPQLGFDGGLDYRWGLCESNMTVKRFDVDTPVPKTPEFQRNIRPIRTDIRKIESNAVHPTQLSDRDGAIFSIKPILGLDDNNAAYTVTSKPEKTSLHRDGQMEMKPQKEYDGSRRSMLEYYPCTPKNSPRSASFAQITPDKTRIERRHNMHRRNPRLFNNIKFAIPKESTDAATSTAHRKTTVVERSDEYVERSSPCVFDADYPRISRPIRRSGGGTREAFTGRNGLSGTYDSDEECFEYMDRKNEKQESSVFDEHGANIGRDVAGLNLCNGSQEEVVERLKPLTYNGSMEFQRRCINGELNWSIGC